MFKIPLLKKLKQLLMLEMKQMPRAVTQSQAAESLATETDND
jgi:hypothetical protein